MVKTIESYIICPECKGDLASEAIEGLNILVCSNGHSFPVFNEVPVLVRKDIILGILNEKERKVWQSIRNRKVDVGGYKPNESLLVKSAKNWSMQWKEHTLENSVWQKKKTSYDYLPITKDDIHSAKVILDIGTGNGRFIQHTHKDNTIFALDISESAYYVRKRYPGMKNVFVVRADLCNLPFRDNTFDLIVADRVMHHIYDLDKAFSEIKRTASDRHIFAFNFFRKEGNFCMTNLVIPAKKLFFSRLPLPMLRIFSYIFGMFLLIIVNLVYRPIHSISKKAYKHLPLHSNMEFWFPFNYGIYRMLTLDLLHSPVDHYFSSRQIDGLVERNGLEVIAKKSFRQVFWLIRGKFTKDL